MRDRLLFSLAVTAFAVIFAANFFTLSDKEVADRYRGALQACRNPPAGSPSEQVTKWCADLNRLTQEVRWRWLVGLDY